MTSRKRTSTPAPQQPASAASPPTTLTDSSPSTAQTPTDEQPPATASTPAAESPPAEPATEHINLSLISAPPPGTDAAVLYDMLIPLIDAVDEYTIGALHWDNILDLTRRIKAELAIYVNP